MKRRKHHYRALIERIETLNTEISINDLEKSLHSLNFEQRWFSSDEFIVCPNTYHVFVGQEIEQIFLNTEKHIYTFSKFKTSGIIQLNEELRSLKSQLKQNPCGKLVLKIKILIDKIKELAFKYVGLYRSQLRNAKNKITSIYSRNLRLFYRQIIRFRFKNLDDESHSVSVDHSATERYFFTVKDSLNEIQKNFKASGRSYQFKEE